MKVRLFSAIAILIASLSGCGTTSLPVAETGNSGEYIVVARNMESVFSNLEAAQQEAVTRAMEKCSNMGKVYKKRYSIDKPMAVGQVPESTLYFSCEDKSTANETSTALKPPPTSDIFVELTKLDDLRKRGILTQEEFDAQKKKLLENN